MVNTIDVSTDGGMTWNQVWISTANGISGPTIAFTDTAWTKQVLDITAYKSATMQIRWAYSNADVTQGGWNIDDVRIMDDDCP